MQTGTIKYDIMCEPVGALLLDVSNKMLINCASTGELICRDFYGGKKILFKDKPILHENKNLSPLPLSRARLCDHNNLLSTADISGRIYIYDLKTFLLSRVLRYGAVPLQITDLAFLLPLGKILLSSSRDGSLLFWDIISGSVLERIIFDIPVLSIDVSHTGEFIATAHSQSLAIHLWVNKNRFEAIQPTGVVGIPICLTTRPKLLRRIQKNKAAPEIKKTFDIQAPEVISKVPKNKWKILMHLEEIKRRNEANMPKQDLPEMPFFLFDLDSITNMQDAWDDASQEENIDLFNDFEKSRLYDNRKDTIEHFIKAGDKNYELQLNQLLNTDIEEMKGVIELIEKLPPSAIQYEISSLRYAGEASQLDLDQEKQELLRKLKLLINIVGRALQQQYHIDTAQAVLSQLLKIYDEELMECEEEVEKVSDLIEKKGKELSELCGGVECMVDYLIEASRKK